MFQKWDLLRRLMVDRVVSEGYEESLVPDGEKFKEVFFSQPEGLRNLDLIFWNFIDILQTKKQIDEL